MDYVADYENGLVTVYMNKFSTLAVITSDTAIVAFETNGGSEIDPVEVNFGEKLAKPADPTKDGYIFAGWYTDEELTEAYDFDQEVTEDMYLYAKWTKKDDSKNPTKDPIKDPGKDNGKNNGKDGQKTQPAKNTDKKAQTVAAKTAASSCHSEQASCIWHIKPEAASCFSFLFFSFFPLILLPDIPCTIHPRLRYCEPCHAPATRSDCTNFSPAPYYVKQKESWHHFPSSG